MGTKPQVASNGITLPIHWHIVWAPIIGWVLVAAIATGASIWGWSAYINHRDKADAAAQSIAHEKNLVDQNSAGVAEAQVADLQRQVAQVATQNAQLKQELLNAIAQRNSETATREQTERTAPISDIESRWTRLVPAANGGITSGPAGLVATDAASRATVEALENGETEVANYQDLSRLDTMKDQQIAGLNKLVDSMTASSKAVQTVLQDQVASCKSDAKAAADAAAKKSRKSFWKGLATGAAAVGAIALRFL